MISLAYLPRMLEQLQMAYMVVLCREVWVLVVNMSLLDRWIDNYIELSVLLPSVMS